MLKLKFVLASVFIVLFLPHYSEADVTLETTKDPEQYAAEFMQDIRSEGIVKAQTLFAELGLANPQYDSVFAMVALQQGKPDQRFSKVIGSIDNAGVLYQVYAYSYLGNNVWTYWRVDFTRISETKWAVANVFFNSDYNAVIAQNFQFLE